MLRLIAASQQRDKDIEKFAATDLLGCGDVEALLTTSRSLANALQASHLILAPIERLPVSLTLPRVPHSYTLQ